MKLKITAFGIAQDILKNRSLSLEIKEEATIGDVREILESKYPDFTKLASLSFAVDEEYQEDTYHLSPGEEVVIIPPVSGG